MKDKRFIIEKILSLILVLAALCVIYADYREFRKEIADNDDIDVGVPKKEEILVTEGDFVFTLEPKSQSLTLKKSNSNEKNVIIPQSVNGYKVTSIGSLAFNSTKSLVEITIPDGVTSVGSMAFLGCSSLETVNISASVLTVGKSAFRNCFKLKTVNFADESALRSIEDSAFCTCISLESIVLPDSVAFVERSAFALCTSLESVTLGKELLTVGEYAFKGCTSLKSVALNSVNSTRFGSYECPAFEDCIALTEITIDNEVKSIGDCFATGLDGVTQIVFPAGLEAIGSHAFRNCGITSISLPSSVKSVGEACFRDCIALETVRVENSALKIGRGALDGTSWYDSHSDGLVLIGNTVYKYKGRPETNISIVLDEGIEGIAGGAFESLRMVDSITLPSTVRFIDAYAFNDGFYGINWADGVSIQVLGDYAFAGYNGDSIVIPESVTTIGKFTFYGCGAELVWDENCRIKELGESSLRGYSGFSITIPACVEKIGDYAFFEVESVIEWEEGARVTELGAYAFAEYNRSIVHIPDSVTSIGAYCFSYSSADFVFSNNSKLEVIGEHVYSEYGGIQVFIPASVRSIATTAFDDCYELYLVKFGGTEEQWKAIISDDTLYSDLEYADVEFNADLDEWSN